MSVARFVLELATLVALAVAGWSVHPLLSPIPPVGLAVVWGRWIAPRAGHRLPDPPRLALELVLFAAVAAALVATGRPVAGIGLGMASAVVAVAVRVTGTRA